MDVSHFSHEHLSRHNPSANRHFGDECIKMHKRIQNALFPISDVMRVVHS